MNASDVFQYYSREDVQEAMMKASRNREVAGVFRSGEYSKRPGMLVYPKDIIAMVRSGVLEFHGSIEHWSNPMGLRPENYNDLRTGWDMILDLDCKDFEHGRIAAKILCRALEEHDIRNYSVKFTGGTGFHVGIPWACVPRTVDYKASAGLFPDLARNIGLYVKGYIREGLGDALLKKYAPEELAEQAKKTVGSLFEHDEFNPFAVVDVDPILISPRHLFRMPYSLNKKKWLVSLPLRASDLDDFRMEDAAPSRIRPKLGFLDSGEEGEARLLISEAIDWAIRSQKARRKYRERTEFSGRIPEDCFPACIKQIMNGLSDGRKRSLFILITFLRSVGWEWNDTEKMVDEWNAKNSPPLGDNYVRSQVRWHRQQNRRILPPNFTAPGWYKDFGISDPESEKLVNPVNVAMKRFQAGEEITQKKRGQSAKRL